VPDKLGRVAEIPVHGVPGIVIAITSGKNNYTEFHEVVTVICAGTPGVTFVLGEGYLSV
jgi:hypothetical protein